MKIKQWEKLMKRGLAVLLSLAVCMSTGQIRAFAEPDGVIETETADNAVSGDPAVIPGDSEVVPVDPAVILEDPVTVPGDSAVTPVNPLAVATDPVTVPSDSAVTPVDTSAVPSDPAVTPAGTEAVSGVSSDDSGNDMEEDQGSALDQSEEHIWDEGVVTKEATCSETGVRTYTCQEEGCGETKTEEIPMTGHTDEEENEICDTCGACLADADSEAVWTFLAAVEALKNQEVKEDAGEAEMEQMLADIQASYEDAKTLYDGLTDGQKLLDAVQGAYADLTDIGAGLNPVTLEENDTVSGEMTGNGLLQKAVNGVITLDGDVTITDDCVWVQNTLTLDLNGHTIHGRVACYGGNLTIRDSIGGGTVITGEGQGCTLLNNGEAGVTTLTIEGGTFTAPQGVNSLYNMNGAVANIKGGTFENGVGNGWWDGASAQDGNGVVNISGGILKAHTFETEGWTVFVPAISNSAEVNISDSADIRSENDATAIENYGVMAITGGSVKAKNADFGLIGNYYSGTISIHSGEFVGKIDNWFLTFAKGGKPIKIYGGQFTFPEGFADKMHSYLIDGLMFDENGRVVENPDTEYVARVDSQGYATLQEAVSAAKEGGTAILLKNVTEDVTVNGTVILDLNGKVLTGAGASAAVINRGTLTITDSADAADETTMGTIVGVNVANKPKSAVINEAGATCTIAGGRITRAPYLESTAQDDPKTNSNYTVQNKGTMYITGGLIVNNSSKSSMVVNLNNQGKGIYGQNKDVKMVISGGTLRQDTYTALKNDPNSDMQITGSARIINMADSSYVTQFYGNVTIDGGSFQGGQLWICSHADVQGHYPTNVNITGGSIQVSEIRAIYGYTTSPLDGTEKVTVNISGAADITCPKWYELKYNPTSKNYEVVRDNSMSEIAVSGGTFSAPVSSEHCAEGFVPVTEPDGNGKYTVATREEAAVAAITVDGNTAYYLTLQEAVKAAKDGDTVTLLKDAELITRSGNKQASYVSVQKKLILDLNGHTASGGYLWVYGSKADVTIQNTSEGQTGRIDGTPYGVRVSGTDNALVNVTGGTVASGSYGIVVQQGITNISGGVVSGGKCGITTNIKTEGNRTITITGGEVKCTAEVPTETTSAISAMYGTQLTVSGSDTKISGGFAGISVWDEGTRLTMTGGTVTGVGYGITGNGSADGTTIELSGGTVTASGVGIYHPQQGTLTVPADSTVSVTGLVGLQICGGTADIASGTFVSTDTEFRANPLKPGEQNDGTAQDGAALSILSREVYGNVTVNVTGGTFTAQAGNKAVRMYGLGQVDGVWTASEEHPYATAVISGGTFSSEVPADYCAEGYEAVDNGDQTYTVMDSSKVPDTDDPAGDDTPGGTTGGNTSGDTTGGNTSGGTTGGNTSGSTTGSSSSGGNTSVPAVIPAPAAPAAVPAPAAPAVVTPAVAAAAAPVAVVPAAEDTPAEAEDVVEVDDGAVPLAGGDDAEEAEEETETETDYVMLEDEEIPLAEGSNRNWLMFGVIPLALASLLIFFIILFRRKKKEEEEA